MARQEQCRYCGAVLLPEDDFCGECGAPRPEAASPVPSDARPSTFPPAGRPEAAPKPEELAEASPSAGTQTGWRAAFIALMIVGALVCLLGLSVFLFAGLTEAEGSTDQENWIFATLCCLLPIAGSGLVLMVAGAGIWYSRLRES